MKKSKKVNQKKVCGLFNQCKKRKKNIGKRFTTDIHANDQKKTNQNKT